MKNIIENDIKFEWENTNLISFLSGNLPKIEYYYNEKDIRNELQKLQNELDSYDAFFINKNEFINKIRDNLNNIESKHKKYLYGINMLEIQECINMHRVCLIFGMGGIGKSYFIRNTKKSKRI